MKSDKKGVTVSVELGKEGVSVTVVRLGVVEGVEVGVTFEQADAEIVFLAISVRDSKSVSNISMEDAASAATHMS